MKYLLFLILLTIFFGCKLKVETNLLVNSNKTLQLIDEKGKSINLNSGSYKVTMHIDEDINKPVEMKLKLPAGKKVVYFQLPKRNDIFYANEPLYVDSQESKQNLQIVITRQPDVKDLFTIFFIDQDMDDQLAKIQFRHESKHIAFDQSSNSFLESYQKVVRKNRGVMLLVDADMDVEGDKASQAWDNILNYSAKYFVAPWIFTRYSNIKWALGNFAEDQEFKKIQWTDLLKKSAVIDYFSYVHNDRQWEPFLNESTDRKPNQLRYVYTSGCGSESSSEWITEYGAIAGTGHFDISASPLFQFALTKNWIYGLNLKRTVSKAWKSGVLKIKTIGWISFSKYWVEEKGFIDWESPEEMINSSELMVSHIGEIPIDKIAIDLSAVAKKSYNDSDVLAFTDLGAELSEDTPIIIEHRASQLVDN